MAFPAAFIDELVARNPIEDVVGQYVSLNKRTGANLFGLCPFHGEKTASFSVNPSKGIYYCFGCHKGGGAINFMMEIEGMNYPDAVRALAKRVGVGKYMVRDEYGSKFEMIYFGDLEKFHTYVDEKYGAQISERLYHGQAEGLVLSVIYYPSLNEFRGNVTMQYIMQDFQ